MRKPALAAASPRQQVARTVNLPSPYGGLNARDGIAAMKAADAVVLDNWWCLPSKVVLRSGAADWATGITGTVNTLARYDAALSSRLFAAAGANIYDVTSTGAVGAAVQSGLTSDQWQHTNFATAGGQFLVMVNGADKLRLYDGATWTAVDNATVPAITGIATTSLIHVTAHKSRLWFIERNSLRAWYLPTLSVGGAAASFDLSSVCPAGGYLVAAGTWSLDGGYGMDDHLVFITSQGEIAVYRGTDPASAATWALVGVYQVGTPIGRRCLVKYAGDLLVISKDGLMPLSKALMSSRVNTKQALTDKIQQLVSQDTTDYGAVFGWDVVPYPPENMLLINVPEGTGVAHQYAMNTISGAWTKFTGWNAACWEVWGDVMYFGTSGKVAKAWTGTSDFNANITANALQAFSAFGAESRIKLFVEGRPIVGYDNPPGILFGMNVDFNMGDPAGVPTFSSAGAAIWDSAVWDAAVWPGGEEIKRDWQTVGAVGTWGGVHMKIVGKSTRLSWFSTDVVFHVGGTI